MSRNGVFPREEYSERLARLRAEMQARDTAALIVDECEMLHYFTGFAISQNLYRAAVIPLQGEPIMVVRRLDEAPFLTASWCERRRAFLDTEDPVAVLAEVLTENGWRARRVGLDLDSYCMPVKRFEQLRGLLPDATFIDFSDVLRPLRLRKSTREIDMLRRAAAIADRAMQETIASVTAGCSPRDAAAVAAAAFVRHGADSGRTGPITSARGWNFLHGALHDEPLSPGDVLHMELVPKVSGYCARLMRPTVIGEPSPEQRAAAESLVALQDRQIAAMRPGALGCEVDAILRNGALAAGLRERYENNTGYTLGYYFEQAPRTSDFTRVFTPQADWRLEPGMVFHMYTSAKGLAFSETVLVTEAGPERLTRLARELFVR
ncbi:MAG: Xaa-Pro peptidase family protein [Gammaproteobacteria bacterium]|nr:Xaa-Pro peptidase family protein [Gammaproteobacteria bacterium]